MPNGRAWWQDDASGRYRIRVEESIHAGFATSYTWRVLDKGNHLVEIATDIAHRDADAWSEAWATVALCLANNDSHLVGAYSIGTSGY